MELTIYDVIRGPVLSDKAYGCNTKYGQVQFKVHIKANKRMIKEAVETIFKTKVDSVSTAIRQGKNKLVKGMRNKKRTEPSEKRATIRLKKGFSLNLFEQASGGAQQSESQV